MQSSKIRHFIIGEWNPLSETSFLSTQGGEYLSFYSEILLPETESYFFLQVKGTLQNVLMIHTLKIITKSLCSLGAGPWALGSGSVRGTVGTDRQILGGVTFAASVPKKQGMWGPIE